MISRPRKRPRRPSRTRKQRGVADFAALERVFTDVAERPLDGFFAQWVQRQGAPALQLSLRTSLAEVEREHIERVLNDLDGNITKAAAALGIDRRTLQRKLRKS